MDQKLINKLSSFSLLYVEDEEGIRNNIKEILSFIFQDLYLARDGEEALKIYREVNPDIIITDIKMPKMNGIELIKTIRKEDSKTRIIIISAHTDLDYVLEAVELRLVKYIVKPITEAKLVEAFNSILETYDKSNIYTIIPNWMYDEKNALIKSPDENIVLTKKENLFLHLLITKKRIITYSEIENQIWTEDNIMTQNALRLFIKNFRKKLPKGILKNVQGVGYQLNQEEV